MKNQKTQNQYAQLSKEELLQKNEELQAMLSEFEDTDTRLVMPDSVHFRIDLESAFSMQESIRDLVSRYNADLNTKANQTLIDAMHLLELLTPTYSELEKLRS